jgi:hypothetical protein
MLRFLSDQARIEVKSWLAVRAGNGLQLAGLLAFNDTRGGRCEGVAVEHQPFLEQFADGGYYPLRLHLHQAVVVALRAHAPEAIPARHVVEQHPVRDQPWRVLWVRLRIQVDQRRAKRRADVRRAGIVSDHYRRQRDRRTQLAESELTGK